jgi:hypothetical protein
VFRYWPVPSAMMGRANFLGLFDIGLLGMTPNEQATAAANNDDSSLMDWLENNASSAVRVIPDEENEDEKEEGWEVSKGGVVTGRGQTLRDATIEAMKIDDASGSAKSVAVGTHAPQVVDCKAQGNAGGQGFLQRIWNKVRASRSDASLQPGLAQDMAATGSPMLLPIKEGGREQPPVVERGRAVTLPVAPVAGKKTAVLTRVENMKLVEAQLEAATDPKEIVRISRHLDAVARGDKSGAYVPAEKSSEYQALSHRFDLETCPKERTRIACHLRAMDMGTAVGRFVSRDEIQREESRLKEKLESSACPRERFNIAQRIDNLPR